MTSLTVKFEPNATASTTTIPSIMLLYSNTKKITPEYVCGSYWSVQTNVPKLPNQKCEIKACSLQVWKKSGTTNQIFFNWLHGSWFNRQKQTSRIPINKWKEVLYITIKLQLKEYAISKYIYSFQIPPDVSFSKSRELLYPILV